VDYKEGEIILMVRKPTKPYIPLASQIYLLPDEVCLAEAQYAVFELHCEREGFRFFDWGCIDININCQIFLTDIRVSPSNSTISR
jgi:hypothetical protein